MGGPSRSLEIMSYTTTSDMFVEMICVCRVSEQRLRPGKEILKTRGQAY